ncbi:hypothetical protein B0A54_10883 [Friedmanniomyces endolithicus]|uniref:Phosphatidylglycerophosphatase GEP4, mitochondrial n=1 Tax=Friedmanniomyces endolithicus TaxID=329885 RepID=A0A4U0UW22_9PEZI|nr:hypothetical protein B0A54_10883 [Friedmanniomyces endolithicus]
MNVSASINVLRLLANPTLCLPHYTVSTFDQLPLPLSSACSKYGTEKGPDIRAVVLDKDNCFAVPKQNSVYPAYSAKFDELRKAYPDSRLLIVSNSAGTSSDKGYQEADLLERNTGVKVLRHTTKKPGCHAEIMSHFRNAPETGVTASNQVAIVGDRLFTDVLMANMMGSHSVWIKDGVVPDHGLVCENALFGGLYCTLISLFSYLASRKDSPVSYSDVGMRLPIREVTSSDVATSLIVQIDPSAIRDDRLYDGSLTPMGSVVRICTIQICSRI